MRGLPSAPREPFFVQLVFTPKPRVIVFGANPDAIPLAKWRASVGFAWSLRTGGKLSAMWSVFRGWRRWWLFQRQLVEQLQLNVQDYVIVMSHQFEKDTAFVRGAMESSLRYLGIMGSKDRTEKMLEGFERPDWLHYPIGLNIGSEGAVENAVSIVAELIRMKRGVRTTGEWTSSVAHGAR